MNEPGGFVKMLKCGIDCCKYESDRASKIRRHQANIHDLNVVWFPCNIGDCDFKTKNKEALKNHLVNLHDIGEKNEYLCDQEGCNYKSKTAGCLKNHLANIHDIGIQWHYCQEPDCNFKAKQKQVLKGHKARIHGIDVTWFYCNEPSCTYKAMDAYSITRHKSSVHNLGVKWHFCQEPNCEYKAKSACHLKTHKMNIHNLGVKWHYCQESNCDFKAKHASDIKRHKSDVHNIGVKWYFCQEPDCEYKSKHASHIKVHREFLHDIGTNQCEYCCNNRNSKNRYFCKITGISSNICNGCYNKVTGKNTRKEKEWSDYLDKHLGTNGLLSSDKNLKSVGGCQRYRPDKLYTDLNYVELAECDEFEHRHSNMNYQCDERRISEIYEEDGIIGKNMAVLRWNPDNYTPKEGLKKLSRKERLKVYVELSKKLREKTSHADKIHIYYLFYSEDNPRLSKNIPYTMIHNLDEISHI